MSGRNYRYFETSCVTGHNIDKVCIYVCVHCKGGGDSLGIVKAKSYASRKKDSVLISLIVLNSERCTQWWKRCTSWDDSVVNFVCYAWFVTISGLDLHTYIRMYSRSNSRSIMYVCTYIIFVHVPLGKVLSP